MDKILVGLLNAIILIFASYSLGLLVAIFIKGVKFFDKEK